MHRARNVGRGVDFNVLSEHATLPKSLLCSPTQKFIELHTFGIFFYFWEASSHRHDHTGMIYHHLHFQFSLLKRIGVGLKIPSFESWLPLSSDWDLSTIPLKAASLEQKRLLSIKKLQGFQEPCVGTRVKDKILEPKKCSQCS